MHHRVYFYWYRRMGMDHSNITTNLVYIIDLVFYIESVLILRYIRMVQIPVHMVLFFRMIASIHQYLTAGQYSDTYNALSL